jgi:hypothetical protein
MAWEVREAGSLFGLFHPWESLERGNTPPGRFYFRETALPFRLIWPALGRDRLFRLSGTATTEGYPIEAADQVVGLERGSGGRAQRFRGQIHEARSRTPGFRGPKPATKRQPAVPRRRSGRSRGQRFTICSEDQRFASKRRRARRAIAQLPR